MIDPASQLNFLWAKWSHHDTLLHSRPDRFWASQAALFALLAVFFESNFFDLPIQLLPSILLPVFGYFGIRIVKTMRIDRHCRNSFNKQIVLLLSKYSDVLDNSRLFADRENKNEYKGVENWHAPKWIGRNSSVKTTINTERLIYIISASEIGIGSLWFIGLLILRFLESLELVKHINIYLA